MKFDAITLLSTIDFKSGGTVALTTPTLSVSTGGNFFYITGTGTVTGIDTTATSPLFLVFDNAVTFTDSGTLVMPGGVNAVTQAGDVMVFFKDHANNWVCTNHSGLGQLIDSDQVDVNGTDLTTKIAQLEAATGSAWNIVEAGNQVAVAGTYSAAKGEKIFIDSTAGSFTIELPDDAVLGDTVEIVDASVTDVLATNPVTVSGGVDTAGPTNQNMMAADQDIILDQNNISLTFIYATQALGWRISE